MADPPEFDWDDLLFHVKRGEVIPIVGRDLITVDGAPLEQKIAARFAQENEVPGLPPPPFGLADVALRYLSDGRGSVAKLQTRLTTLLEELAPSGGATPDALRQLAEVRAFRLFVTTTPDTLMEDALRQVRKVEPHSLAYFRTARPEDIANDIETSTTPSVYHIFGSARHDYAVTEEDVLEFLSDLQAGKRPPYLFDALREHHLLFLGCGFHDWLARFFIRIMKDEPFSNRGRRAQIVADQQVQGDGNLVMFLKHYELEVFHPGSAADFVAELNKRWLALAGPAPVETPAASQPLPGMIKGAVFLSYSRTNKDPVRRIAKALNEAGIDVWFDETDLEGGDDFDQVIRQNIRNCSLFLPFMSREAESESGRYFRIEWRAAAQQAERYFGTDVKFIIPVAIDDVAVSSPGVPQEFRPLNWVRLPSGEPTKELIDLIRTEYRRKQAPQYVK